MYAHIITYHQVFEKVETLTYKIPPALSNIKPGMIVEIPFGKVRTNGVVIHVQEHLTEKTNFELKSIICQVQKDILLEEKYITLSKKLATYYHLPLYRFIQLFLPKDILLGTYKPSANTYIEKGKYWEQREEKISKRAYKQREVLDLLYRYDIENTIALSDLFTHEIYRKDLNPLIEKEIIQLITKEKLVDVTKNYKEKGKKNFTLNETQQHIFQEILKDHKKPHLIHGVTGSGKTEVYISLVQEMLRKDENAQALILIPEINLTPQTISRFKDHFDTISVWHSRLSKQEKLDQWMKIHRGTTKVIIGSRSSIFTPIKNLKLIIMDEEHDKSFKQESSPRYNTHKIIFELQKIQPLWAVLGSATPRVETLWGAHNKKIHLHEMKETYTLYAPKIQIIDLKNERMSKGSCLSYPLRLKIAQTLEKKEQVLLFLNRRGFAPSYMCTSCGFIHSCNACEMPTTYHTRSISGYLSCHFCGKNFPCPQKCPQCKGAKIFPLGTGTQRIEEEIKTLYPQANVCRIDQDTMTKKESHKKVYEDILSQKIDIIVGTQMIAKGLDFENLTLVGVILADYGLGIPDFRAEEKTFQLLSQVSGRSGRHKPGEVIVQTFNSQNSAIKAIQQGNFTSLYEKIIQERKMFAYPPFSRLIRINFTDSSLIKTEEKAKFTAKKLEEKAKPISPNIEIIGPSSDLIVKKSNQYYYHLFIKYTCQENEIQKLLQHVPLGCVIDRDPYTVV